MFVPDTIGRSGAELIVNVISELKTCATALPPATLTKVYLKEPTIFVGTKILTVSFVTVVTVRSDPLFIL